MRTAQALLLKEQQCCMLLLSSGYWYFGCLLAYAGLLFSCSALVHMVQVTRHLPAMLVGYCVGSSLTIYLLLLLFRQPVLPV